MLRQLGQVVGQIVRMKPLERLRDLLMKLRQPQPRNIRSHRFRNHSVSESEAARRVAEILHDSVRHRFGEPRDADRDREPGHLREQMGVELAAYDRRDLDSLARVARERRNFLSDGLAHAVGNRQPGRDSVLQAGAPIGAQQSQRLVEKKRIAFGHVAQRRNQPIIGREGGVVGRECGNFLPLNPAR